MDPNFWDEIERSRKLSGSERMSASLQLFDEAARRMLAGVKHQHPGMSDEDALRMRNERIDRIRRVESLP
jgi:hypothetical protein